MPPGAKKAGTKPCGVIGEVNSWFLSDSYIRSRRLPTIKLCLLAITRRHLTYSKSCVGAKSESMIYVDIMLAYGSGMASFVLMGL